MKIYTVNGSMYTTIEKAKQYVATLKSWGIQLISIQVTEYK